MATPEDDLEPPPAAVPDITTTPSGWNGFDISAE
jgi:hypothetical protein